MSDTDSISDEYDIETLEESIFELIQKNNIRRHINKENIALSSEDPELILDLSDSTDNNEPRALRWNTDTPLKNNGRYHGKNNSYGTGRENLDWPRRPNHCNPEDSNYTNKTVQMIDSMNGTERGLTIVLKFEGERKKLKFEHNDIWKLKNGPEEVKKFYMTKAMDRSQKGLKHYHKLRTGRFTEFFDAIITYNP